MADTEFDPQALKDAFSFDLSHALSYKYRRKRKGPIDRLRGLFQGERVEVSLKFFPKDADGGVFILTPILCFFWKYDRGMMMFPEDRRSYIAATKDFVPPRTALSALPSKDDLVTEAISFLRRHSLKLVASDSRAPVLRLECRMRKKGSTVAVMTFQTDHEWVAKEREKF